MTVKVEEGSGSKRRDKPKLLSKIIVRRLPPTMSEDLFMEQISPMPDHDDFYYVPGDWTLGQNASSRAYITFSSPEDIFIFKDKFDGYVFVDAKGAEFPAVVEYAPFQSLPKNRSRKKDTKSNTIESDTHFISFLESLKNDENEKGEAKMEYSYQVKDEKKITSTPLLEFLASQKLERKEKRRKREDDRKRQRDDEKNKKKITIAKPANPIRDENKDDDGITVRVVPSRLDRGQRNRNRGGGGGGDRDKEKDRRDDRNKDREKEREKNREKEKARRDERDKDNKDRKRNDRDKDRQNRRSDRDRGSRKGSVSSITETKNNSKSGKAVPETSKNSADPPQTDGANKEKPELKVEVPEEAPVKVEVKTEFKVAEVKADTKPVEKTSQPVKGSSAPAKKEIKKYSERRKETRARAENRLAENIKQPDTPDPKKEIVLENPEPTEKPAEKPAVKTTERPVYEKSNSMESTTDSNNGKKPDVAGETATAAEKRAEIERKERKDRIRNKDRPSIAIYQPGRSRNLKANDEKPKEKSGNESEPSSDRGRLGRRSSSSLESKREGKKKISERRHSKTEEAVVVETAPIVEPEAIPDAQ